MVLYPWNTPIILSEADFLDYGGKKGSFSSKQLNASYWIAEREATQYIGAFLLPVIVTGTHNFQGQMRIATDYGYVSRILNVSVLSQKSVLNCDIQVNAGCAFIYEDTFGYLDVRQIQGACGLPSAWAMPVPMIPGPIYDFRTPYQFQVTYESGLPTGTANLPGILEALTILAQLDLNEKDPGNSGMNESPGDVGVQEFSSMQYRERRLPLKRSALGQSAKAQYAMHLLDISIRKCRRSLTLR